MRKIRILNIVPDIYTEGIAVSVKDRQALAAALKEETGGLACPHHRNSDQFPAFRECGIQKAIQDNGVEAIFFPLLRQL